MKVYDLFFRADTPRLMKKGLTEEQVDKFWNSLEWWKRDSIDIKEREIPDKDDRDER